MTGLKMNNKIKTTIKLFLYFNPINYYLNRKLNFNNKRKKFNTRKDILINHFNSYSSINHINYKPFSIVLQLLKKKSLIVETGSSAYGTNSTLLFDSFLNSFGGKLYTCDLRIEPALYLQKLATDKTIFFHLNSLIFLKKLHINDVISDFIYLDSMDVNTSDFSSSMIHGLNEFFLADKILKKGGLILIDDTPLNLSVVKKIYSYKDYLKFLSFYMKFKFVPGKGALVKNILQNNRNYKILYQNYSLLIKKIK
jgi:hypothetical protein